MNDDARPSPEELLSLAQEEEKKAHKGKLKIFFGSSAGVGKTCSMLSAAQELKQNGVDVVIGIVETHKRPHTESLKDGLPVLKTIDIPYRGLLIPELDLDRALELRPHTILVDELAHTNTPGSRHPKRWNDVMELLDAGINVFTTLNVQHIESLSDVVASTTGVWVKETVPDSVFDMAEDIVLVDIDEDDLIKRLHEGHVYIAPGANQRAADNFFKKENLSALRQLALRRTAERVDAERDQTLSATGRHPVSDKILVCVGADDYAAKLVRATKRLASALRSPWVALYVERGDPRAASNQENRRKMEVLERMVDRLDGTMVTVHGNDLHDEIISYAQKNKITKIVIGKDSRLTLRSFFEGLLVNKVIRSSGFIDVIVVSEDRFDIQPVALSWTFLSDLRPLDYVLSLVLAGAFTIPGLFLATLITSTDQALLYLAGIVLVAEMLGLGPAMFYALMAACAFVGLFATKVAFMPTNDRAYLMTFLVMLVTGYSIAKQSAKLKAQAISSRLREERTRALYDLTRKLTAARGRFPVADTVGSYIRKTFDVEVTIWMNTQDGRPAVIVGDLPEDSYYKDLGALQWCLESGKNAGRGTSTMPSASGFYLPLTTDLAIIGALGVYPPQEDRLLSFDDIATLETLASLLASALERVRAGEIAQQAVVENENKKLRESLLNAFGDSLQIPITTMSATVNSFVRSTGLSVSDDFTRKMAEAFNETKAMGKNIVGQLMDVHSIESGSIQANRIPCSILERFETVIERLHLHDGRYETQLNVPADLPDIMVDPKLVDQLIQHITENAMRFSPHGTTITFAAQREEGELVISIADQGEGFPQGTEHKIFDKFYALSDLEDNKSFGLGLTIASGIVRLHGGRIWAENNPSSGAKVSFTLPLA